MKGRNTEKEIKGKGGKWRKDRKGGRTEMEEENVSIRFCWKTNQIEQKDVSFETRGPKVKESQFSVLYFKLWRRALRVEMRREREMLTISERETERERWGKRLKDWKSGMKITFRARTEGRQVQGRGKNRRSMRIGKWWGREESEILIAWISRIKF